MTKVEQIVEIMDRYKKELTEALLFDTVVAKVEENVEKSERKAESLFDELYPDFGMDIRVRIHAVNIDIIVKFTEITSRGFNDNNVWVSGYIDERPTAIALIELIDPFTVGWMANEIYYRSKISNGNKPFGDVKLENKIKVRAVDGGKFEVKFVGLIREELS
jgi:hypothetical protein